MLTVLDVSRDMACMPRAVASLNDHAAVFAALHERGMSFFLKETAKSFFYCWRHRGQTVDRKAVMKLRYMPLALLGATLMIATTAQAQDNYKAGVFAAQSSKTSYPCNNAQFLQDQQAFENGQITADQPEDVCGMVTAVLPAKKTRSGNHGYFYVQVASGVTIEIVSDLDQMNAPKWPWVAVGDTTYVQGRYYYDNDDSQGIDWTHHGTSSSWPHAGYVVVNGTKYQ